MSQGSTRPVQLAWPWEGPDGQTHEADEVVEVAEHVARELIFAGLARVPDALEADEPSTDAPDSPSGADDPADTSATVTSTPAPARPATAKPRAPKGD
jgi:hypothetical protein